MRSPCCNAKTTQGTGRLRKCSRCGGLFDPQELASGRVEGGTYSDRDPAARLKIDESGGPRGAPIRQVRKLKGGL